MKRQILISSLILLSIQALAGAGNTYYVPSRDYPTIQSGLTAAGNGDTVIVAPGTYTGHDNVNLDFGGDAITLKSEINPDNPNPDIIATTIIDCGGQPAHLPPADTGAANRAFHFHSGEGPNSKVLGFTIRNGYARGPKGADGDPGYIGYVDGLNPIYLFIPIPICDDPYDCPPYALDGDIAGGNGYGGAILCESASSPTIQYCVIENCTVTGAHGGDGANGLDGTWEHWTLGDIDPCTGFTDDVNNTLTENPDGQWGGWGGDGVGFGFGGAIACRGGSNPIISDCIISDNFARGGRGGNGGDGGNAAEPPDYDEGLESGGGNAGASVGDGIGGAIAVDGTSSPTITTCTFNNNVATTGPRGEGGQRGLGNVLDLEDYPRAPEGFDSIVLSSGDVLGGTSLLAGGAAYYDTNSQANLTNCTFIGNKAYEAYEYYDPSFGEDIAAYNRGGALYSGANGIINLNTCTFTGNLGGAVYCDTGCTVNIHNTYDPSRNCLFSGNSETANGGALHIGPGGTVDLQSCIFGGNSAYDDGGAVDCNSDITLTNCSFGNNRANSDNDGSGYGGAMDAYESGTHLTIDFNNCSFTGNQAVYGGGFSSENFSATLTNCYFIGNTAKDGGGLDLVNGDVLVTGSVLKGNNATDGDGGGFNCRYTAAEIYNCTFMDNSADGVYPTGGNGGAINFYGGAPPRAVFNCLITGNKAAVDGGAIFCHYASPEIGNCTFSGNSAGDGGDGDGGAIFSDFVSEPNIINSIFHDCNHHAIHEEDSGGNAIVTFSLFYNNPDGDYYDSDTGLQTGADNINNNIVEAHDNIDGDPLFESGPLSHFYLRQQPVQPLPQSPAVDAGSADADHPAIGLDAYTTRTDSVGDADRVDMGYHHVDANVVGTFQLKASVVGGHGTVAPTSPAPIDYNLATDTYTYYAGTVVTLTATPNTGWFVKAWSETDDDSSTATTNTVVMNSNRNVTIEFKQPKTFIVAVGGGGEGFYSNITDALHDAEDADIIVVYPGVYYGPQVQLNKDVEIRSQHPDDPNWVEQTIIDSTGQAGPVFLFDSARGPGCILNGLTIQNSTWYTDTGEDGDDPGENGEEGPGAEGGAIWIASGASPVIKNCLIRDNFILGGFGGTGSNADEFHNAGRGGWGGWAYGGAVYCNVNSSPTFINCRIIDNQTVGGIGGNGGTWDPEGGTANYGGNWSRAEWWDRDPGSLNWVWVQGDLWEVWLTTLETDPYIIGDPYIGDYRWYSGYGGGVFINRGCNVTFLNCTISGNLAQGGLSGLGGDEPGAGPNRAKPFPLQYEIPSFGGGVYCAADSNVTFTGCTITDNVSSEPLFDHITGSEGYGDGDLDQWIQDEYDPCDTYSIDPYLGHGGGVCAEDTATVIFTDCNLSGNKAAVGGGIHGGSANLKVSDCEFISNSAYQGGGLFAEHGPATILSSNFTDNIASSDANEPNALGQGGGMHFWATDANITDCNITSNQAEASGGGVYFGGESTPSLTNCLLTKNTAGRDGGAVSTNIFTQLTISNCTMVGNTGIVYGGALNCSYGSYTDIINSIIWNNVGIHGSQVAVGTGFEYDESPSTVDVSHSDVGVPAYEYSGPINADELPVIREGFDDYNLPANDDESTSLVDIGFTLNFFGVETSELYINNNGNVTFDANMMTFTPFGLTGRIRTPIIAPFFADVDTRAEGSDLAIYGTGTVNDRPAFGVNWLNVGYYDTHDDKLNSFQLILIDRSDRAPGDFDIEFNYETLTWETGDASGGSNGFGGQSARAGFSSGTGYPWTYYEFEGSGEPGELLDSGANGLTKGSRESSVNGRYIFVVKNGLPEILTSVPFYVDVNCTLNGFDLNNDTNSWDPNSKWGNISENPNFISGYLLSQIAAGQEVDSPCVDTGSDLASVFGLDTYTTRTDSIPDDGIVDMGYHYNVFLPIQYLLTFTALDVPGLSEADQPAINPNMDPSDPNYWSSDYPIFTTVELAVTSPVPDGYDILWSGTNDDDSNQPTNTVTMVSDRIVTVTFVTDTYQLTVEAGPGGTVKEPWSPGTYTVKHHTVVALEAVPDEGYRVKQWIGSDDNTSTDPCNTVTVDSDKIVTVEFEQPTIITVPGDQSTIQAAIEAAREGDVIQVASGVYYGRARIIDKEITITSTNPDDPNVVAMTVISGEGYANVCVLFTSDAGSNAVLNGLTIANGSYFVIDAEDADENGEDGPDGGGAEGGGIYCEEGSSPTIKNCIIRDCNITGGNAGDAGNAAEGIPAGRGGWGGWARGAGIYIAPYASPTLINCTITNCSTNGADGGNGGNSYGTLGEDYQDAGYGGLWSNPAVGASWEDWGYDGDYRYYSGYGGGVYCDENSSPTFIACNITGNTAVGGMSGIGGNRPWTIPDPVTAYEIPSYGGGVYCAENSRVEFIDCNITNNTAPKFTLDEETGEVVYRIDPYLGHGGGVAFEDGADVKFTNCNISGNLASVGGGIHWSDAEPEIKDCNISGNLAYRGAGIFGTKGSAIVFNCLVSGNFAGMTEDDVNDANDMPVVGQGGGIYSASMESQIIDCTIIDNEATTSGGGILFTGTGANTPAVTNCLMVDNQAGRDGGGLSVNWYATPLITNCTIVGNEATGDFGETGLGGGIYSGYYGHPVILNSILWDNYALQGSEIAVGTGFEYDPRPSTVNVSYSDVKGGATGVFVDTGCTLEWDDGNLYGTSLDNPLFVGSFYLSEPDTGEPSQTEPSPCIDAGLGEPNILCDGPYAYTTRTDNADDVNEIDMGYHYRKAGKFTQGDLNYDGVVDFDDWLIWQADYLNWCGFPCWCQGHDLNRDGVVNLQDEALLKLHYGADDIEPPVPNPSTWDIVPHPTGLTTIGMTATQAYDNSDQPPYYYFQCVTNSNFDSGWQPEREYTPTGLTAGTEYGFRVRATDRSGKDYSSVYDPLDPNDPNVGNKTNWSHIGYTITGEDTTPPLTDPCAANPYKSTWDIPPYATGPNSIMMVATTATDLSGVEYYFECSLGNGNDSSWQNSTTYEDIGLDPCTIYGYRVRARDKADPTNYGYWSDEAFAATLGEEEQPPLPDTTPPTPNPSQWAVGGEPTQYLSGGYYWHTMTAEPASDAENEPVEYYFELVAGGYGPTSSGWQLSNVYDYAVSSNPAQYGVYRVKTRDAVGNETAYSEMRSTLE